MCRRTVAAVGAAVASLTGLGASRVRHYVLSLRHARTPAKMDATVIDSYHTECGTISLACVCCFVFVTVLLMIIVIYCSSSEINPS